MAPAVVTPTEAPVRPSGGRDSEQQLRRGSARSVPASAGTPEQRQATRVRFESPAEHSQDGRTRLSAKGASEKDVQELEPDNLERPSSSSGVVIPSEMPWGGTREVEDVSASPGEIGRQDVSNFQLSRALQFGDEKANLVELASIRVRDALWYRDCDIGKNELKSWSCPDLDNIGTFFSDEQNSNPTWIHL